MKKGLNNKLAEITVNPQTRTVLRIDCHGHESSFRCKRCGAFCCKLGPPKLSQQDIKRLKLSKRNVDRSLDEIRMTLSTRDDGSCVFLSLDPRNSKSRCDIYNIRPTLCRLYPFHFLKLNESTYELRLITCCNGLNTNDGVPIDQSFISRLVNSELLGLIDSDPI